MSISVSNTYTPTKTPTTPCWWGTCTNWDEVYKKALMDAWYPRYLPSYNYTIKTDYTPTHSVNSDGVYERDLPGAEDVAVSVTNTRLKISAVVKGKEFSAESYIPEAYQGSTPTASYKLGVLRIEFTKVEPTEVEVELG